MGYFLGIDQKTDRNSLSADEHDILAARKEFITTAGLWPSSPLISDSDWEELRRYYLNDAPSNPLPQIEHPSPLTELPLFHSNPTRYDQRQALSSLVLIGEDRRQLLIHDGLTEQLTILDRDGDLVGQHPAPGIVLVEGEFEENEVYLLSIGDLFASRIGEGFGELQRARVVGGLFYGLEVLLTDQHRPSDFVRGDLNADGVPDVLLSNFGDYTGNLSLYLGEPRVCLTNKLEAKSIH